MIDHLDFGMIAHSPEAERWDNARIHGLAFRLPPVARFSLTGADRVRYLNGQCTNDVRKLSPNSPAMQACILSARGKLDAVVWIWAEPDRLIVECDATLADALALRLEKYIVADDVTIEPLPPPENEWHIIPGSEPLPDTVTAGTLRRIARFQNNGFDIVTTDIPPGMSEADSLMLDLLRVKNRIPAWGYELHSDTLPAEAGLDRTAVDFHKGCYLGQEVVSRIESVGHANRLLRAFEVTRGLAPTADTIFPHPTQPEKTGASITTVTRDFELSKAVGLCYTRRGVESGDTLISADGSTHITILDPSV